MSPRQPSFSLASTFVHLHPSGAAERLSTSQKGFWAGLKDRQLDGRLVGSVRMTRHTAWEKHPDGEELLILLSGALELVLDNGQNDTTIELTAGRAVLVPCDTWHRQLVHEPGDLLFITPGPNTQHRGVREHEAARGASGS